MMKENIKFAELLQKRISTILLKEWDPIGIQDIPEAQDEYDTYVIPLYKMLIEKRTIHEIFDYLVWAESEHMGLSTDEHHTQLIAKELIKLID